MKQTRGHLLLVDDHDVNRSGFSRLLRHMGFSVSEAGCGQEALRMVEEEGFDIVLLDIGLPDLDGLMVLDKLRLKYTMEDLPVVMVTAQGSSDVMVEAFKRGANDYVAKPIDLDVTMARIKALLSRRAAAGVPKTPTCLKPGSRLRSRYTIEGILGQGGMGAVYQARDGDRPVAIKEMQVTITNVSARASAIKQFEREARILQSLAHPGLVPVFDAFGEDGNQYIVMALVAGTTLETVVQEAIDLLPVPRVLGWARQLCEVLAYLHTQQPPVIFRDLKPSNVMVDDGDHLCLVDFGLARELDADTRTSTFIKGAGTPGFSPVEQFGGSPTDPRSDIYALGATLYSLLTSTIPPMSVQLLAGEASLVSPTRLNPAVTPGLEAVILKMMALRREDRYASIQDVAAALL